MRRQHATQVLHEEHNPVLMYQRPRTPIYCTGHWRRDSSLSATRKCWCTFMERTRGRLGVGLTVSCLEEPQFTGTFTVAKCPEILQLVGQSGGEQRCKLCKLVSWSQIAKRIIR
ncbi:hypothetical protein E2C01_028627 [Portunus trituberculatus]|uniref:Uncharacterized protein n=1 Tax=Portunus trituberculatus TaxID=210409 RepID=A0A5B7EPZ2_PORTR|nr:hypothetical protein [Portunus trituberculatus]